MIPEGRGPAGLEPAARIAEKLPRLPHARGVYVFYDTAGRALYVGKATDLRSRVRSYFGRSSDDRPMHGPLVRAAADVDVMVTTTDTEALILENTLIKRHRPRYNVRLRDDKTYASLAVTVGERFPRLLKVRRRAPGKSLMFGPFPSGTALNATLKVLRVAGGIRTCTNADFAARSRPCLEFEIGHCRAPCVGRQTAGEYRRGVDAVVQFLRGHTEPVVGRLTGQMETAAHAERFEDAAKWRDRIAALHETAKTQRMVDADRKDRDVLGWHRDGVQVTVAVLQVREGTLVSTRRFRFESDLPDAELGAAVIGQLYTREEPPPAEVVVPATPEGAVTLSAWLRERRGGAVRIWRPSRGKGRDLLRLATENAAAEAAKTGARAAARARELAELAGALGLATPPERIECVDVSHLGGTGTVAACITFVGGEPAPAEYRHYRLRVAAGGDDPAGIREVVERRLARAVERGLPDLLLVDGGAAQLAAAVAARTAAGLDGRLAIAALVKEAGLHTKGTTAERLLVPGREAPIEFPRGAPVLHLLQRIRDEAHRFAIGLQRKTRRGALRSGLEGIPGVGPKARKALLARFGSLDGVRGATEADLRATPGLSAKAAGAVETFVRPPAPVVERPQGGAP